MEKIIIGIITYVVSLIEICMYFKFMSVKYESSIESLITLKILICATVTLIIDCVNSINIGFVCGSILNILILLIIGHSIYKSSLIGEVVYTSIYLIMVYGIDMIIASLFGSIDKHIYAEEYFNICLGLIGKILLIIAVNIVAIINKNKSRESNTEMNKLMTYGILVSMISIYALAFGIMNLGEIQNKVIYIWIAMVAIALLMNSIIIYYVIQKFSTELIKQKEYEVIEYQNKLLTTSTLEKNEISKEVRRMWHDFNNHMSCVDMLLQMNNLEKARDYIKNLNASCNLERLDIEVGNEIADIVLSQKIKVANENNIKVKVKGKFDLEIKISPKDLCGILCNSLDNAIEACQKVNVEDRKIEVCLASDNEYMCINVINTMQYIKVDNKRLITTKKDKKNHGIGMMSIKSIVDKYKGCLEWKVEDNIFELSIRLLNESTNNKKSKIQNN